MGGVTTEGKDILLLSKDGPLATPRNWMPCMYTGSHVFALEKQQKVETGNIKTSKMR